MGKTAHHLVLLLLAMLAWPHGKQAAEALSPVPIPAGTPFNKSVFPDGFIFGVGSSAYQYEGAWNEDGKGPSIWDNFTHQYPDKIKDKSNGDVAMDFYHRYKEDVLRVKNLGFDVFRFSIAWTRILPTGNQSGAVNKKGIQYYNDIIDFIISAGMIPFVTLFHWDVPQTLEDSYMGFLSPLIVDDFVHYADICFKEFGDRVKNWVTINEPMVFTLGGYALGVNAPGRCTSGVLSGVNCMAGDSSTEPYNVTHNQLLAHAAAVDLYRRKYQASQNGKIGITFVTTWYVPLADSWSDAFAFQRATDFFFGWYMDPLTYGEYPPIMRTLVGDRLPKFTPEQSKQLKGSFDFITLNYYSGAYVYSIPFSTNVSRNYLTDSFTNTTNFRNGVAIGPLVGPDSYSYPRGIRDFLIYTKEKYNNPIIYITENGVSEVNDPSIPLDEALNDVLRMEYFHSHLAMVYEAIREGVDVRGYMAWTLLDDFEWSNGYTVRIGIYYVDFEDDLKRYPKRSALWFRKFMEAP